MFVDNGAFEGLLTLWSILYHVDFILGVIVVWAINVKKKTKTKKKKKQQQQLDRYSPYGPHSSIVTSSVRA